MASILVLGGTRFFGRRLVQNLIDDGHCVSIGTRGNIRPDFSSEVEYLTLDRRDPISMANVLKGRRWDVVYDQICMDSIDASHSVEALGDEVGLYVLTSSLAVYDLQKKSETSEQNFDPLSYPLLVKDSADVGYAEGKRLAEAFLYQRAKFPVISARFPIVLGEDDYTQRLLKPIVDVLSGHMLRMCADEHEMSLISSAEAGRFLTRFAKMQETCAMPINACSIGNISPHRIVELIEAETGRKALVEYVDVPEGFSLINHQVTWTMSNQLASSRGFRFNELSGWLPQLVESSCRAAISLQRSPHRVRT